MRQTLSNPRQLAEILRGRRRARRLSQDRVALELGVSQSRLSTLEAHPEALTLDRLLLLAKLLGLEIVVQDATETPDPKTEW